MPKSHHVHIVGPTTQANDHHLIHAARGITHVWTAAVVAGLGVVITAALGYVSLQMDAARTTQHTDTAKIALQRIDQRLSSLEGRVHILQLRLEKDSAAKTNKK